MTVPEIAVPEIAGPEIAGPEIAMPEIPRPEIAAAEIIAPDDRSVLVNAAAHPFKVERTALAIPAGATLAEILDQVQPNPILRRHAFIFIGDQLVPRRLWPRVRPKPGSHVAVRVVAGTGGGGGGGGTKNPLKTLLSIAIVAASFAAPFIWTAALPGALGAAGATWGMVIGAGISLAGGLALGFLFPVTPPNLSIDTLRGNPERDSPTAFLSGARNELRPFRPVPRLLGRHKLVPPLGARSYSEVVGDEQYYRLLLVWSIGKVAIEALRVGETPIGDFAEVESEWRPAGSGATLGLFPAQVAETGLAVELTAAAGFQSRTTAIETDEISVDLTFGRGLVRYDDQGNKLERTVSVAIEYAAAGSGAWSAVTTLTVTGRTTAAVRRSHRWAVARGQYDVRLARTTADTTDARIADAATWTALRSIKAEAPLDDAEVTASAHRVRASGRLQGNLPPVKAIGTSIVPDYDGAGWPERATNNPASLFRAVLQDAGNAAPVPDGRLDLARLEDWHGFCGTHGLTFNHVVDYETSVWDLLSLIAAAGRARPIYRDGRWSVLIDRPQPVPVQHFTPANSRNFQGEKTFREIPHGLRVRFFNQEKDWNEDERTVYDDGYDAGTASRIAGLDFVGVTDPDQIWTLARYHLAQLRLRPEVFSWEADVEHLVCERGDRVRVAHDAVLWGLAAGRVLEVYDDGATVTAVRLDTPVELVAAATYEIRLRASADGTTSVYPVVPEVGEVWSVGLAGGPAVGAIAAGDLFMVGETAVESVDVVVTDIRPGPDLTARLTGVEYAPAIYDAPTGAIPPFDSKIGSAASLFRPVVVAVRSDEFVMVQGPDGSWQERIAVAIRQPSALLTELSGVQARFRPWGGDDPWIPVPAADPRAGEIFLAPVTEGETYEIQLRYASAEDVSEWTESVLHQVEGKTAPPPPPSLFRLAVDVDGTRVFRFGLANRPLDFAGFRLRYQPGSDPAPDWAAMTPLHDGLLAASPWETNLLPAGAYTFACKTVDQLGIESETALTFAMVLPDPRTVNQLVAREEAVAGWPGAKLGAYVDAGGDLVTGGAGWSALAGTSWADLAGATWGEITARSGLIVYETPLIDLGADVEVTPRLDQVAATGTPQFLVDTGTEADGGPAAGWAPPDQRPARYVQARLTVLPYAAEPAAVNVDPAFSRFDWAGDSWYDAGSDTYWKQRPDLVVDTGGGVRFDPSATDQTHWNGEINRSYLGLWSDPFAVVPGQPYAVKVVMPGANAATPKVSGLRVRVQFGAAAPTANFGPDAGSHADIVTPDLVINTTSSDLVFHGSAAPLAGETLAQVQIFMETDTGFGAIASVHLLPMQIAPKLQAFGWSIGGRVHVDELVGVNPTATPAPDPSWFFRGRAGYYTIASPGDELASITQVQVFPRAPRFTASVDSIEASYNGRPAAQVTLYSITDNADKDVAFDIILKGPKKAAT